MSLVDAMNSRANGNARFALYAGSHGNHWFRDIRDLIGAGLRESGVEVVHRDEGSRFGAGVDWHVVVAPHEFFRSRGGRVLWEAEWPENLILLNTERASTKRFLLAERCFPRARFIWDMDFESSLEVQSKGHDCRYLPLGYAAGSSFFEPVEALPLEDRTRRFPAEVREWSGEGRAWRERPLEFVFPGNSSPRRAAFFARHARRLELHAGHYQASNGAHLSISGLDLRIASGLADRSRVLLNVHPGSDPCFEWHRIVLLGIARGALVVTEPCSLAPPFRPNIDFVEAPLDQLPERMDYYLSSSSGRREAEAIVEHGARTLREECRLKDALEPLLALLDDARREDWLSQWSLRKISECVAEEGGTGETLEVCVVVPDVTSEGKESAQGASQLGLAEMLARAGHSVTVLHTRDECGEGRSMGRWYLQLSERGVRYVPLPLGRSAPLEAPEPVIRSHATWCWLKGRKFDVVHFPDSQGSAFYSVLGKGQGLGLEETLLCVQAQGPGAWERSLGRQPPGTTLEPDIDFMERESVRRADAVVFGSGHLRDWMIAEGWELPSMGAVLPPLVPRTSRRFKSPAGTALEIAYLGPLDVASGVGLFCDALDMLSEGELRGRTVTFLGRSREVSGQSSEGYLRERSQKWSCPWRVLSELEPEEIWKCLARPGQLAVIAGHFPHTVGECIERGIPFVASDSGGIGEMIDPAHHARALFRPTAEGLSNTLRCSMDQGVVKAAPAVRTEAAEAAWRRWHARLARPELSVAGLETEPMVSVCS